MNDDILIRKYEKDDFDEILNIENECFIDSWNKDALRYELENNPFSNTLVALYLSEVVGFLDYQITFNSSCIVQIGVKTTFRRQGIASKLMQEMLSNIKKHNKNLNEDSIDDYIETMTLEVRESNEKAVDLYKKFGFENIVIKKNYYKDGENAIYMGVWF